MALNIFIISSAKPFFMPLNSRDLVFCATARTYVCIIFEYVSLCVGFLKSKEGQKYGMYTPTPPPHPLLYDYIYPYIVGLHPPPPHPGLEPALYSLDHVSLGKPYR